MSTRTIHKLKGYLVEKEKQISELTHKLEESEQKLKGIQNDETLSLSESRN